MPQVLILSAEANVARIEHILKSTGWRQRRIGELVDLVASSDVDVSEGQLLTAKARNGRHEVLLAITNLHTAANHVRNIRKRWLNDDLRVLLTAPRVSSALSRNVILQTLSAGADDFVSNSRLASELLLRLDALVRRPRRKLASKNIYDINGMLLEPRVRRLRYAERSVTLTPCEYRVLETLAHHYGTPVSRAAIMKRLGPKSKAEGPGIIGVYVLYLRRKLALINSPCSITSARGIGYLLSEDVPVRSSSDAIAIEKREED